MICSHCADMADSNREAYESGSAEQHGQSPHWGCKGCTCMHQPAEVWEKQFSTPNLWEDEKA